MSQRLPEAVTEKGEETRRRVVEVAAEAFAQRGYDGTSLNDVIRASGLTKGGFYFHFPSKEALAREVLAVKREQWRQEVLAGLEQVGSALEQLVALVTMVARKHEDSAFEAVNKLCADLGVAPDYTPWVALTASLIQKGQDEGDVRSDVDPDTYAFILVASFLGFDQLTKHAEPAERARRLEQYLAFVTDAIHVAEKAG